MLLARTYCTRSSVCSRCIAAASTSLIPPPNPPRLAANGASSSAPPPPPTSRLSLCLRISSSFSSASSRCLSARLRSSALASKALCSSRRSSPRAPSAATAAASAARASDRRCCASVSHSLRRQRTQPAQIAARFCSFTWARCDGEQARGGRFHRPCGAPDALVRLHLLPERLGLRRERLHLAGEGICAVLRRRWARGENRQGSHHGYRSSAMCPQRSKT